MISARKTKHLDVKTMFTYSHANTSLGQSERAYYLSYFINTGSSVAKHYNYNNLVTLKNSFILKNSLIFVNSSLKRCNLKENNEPLKTELIIPCHKSQERSTSNFPRTVSRKSLTLASWRVKRSLFSASFQTFCLTARAFLNTQKYGLFCSLNVTCTHSALYTSFLYLAMFSEIAWLGCPSATLF